MIRPIMREHIRKGLRAKGNNLSQIKGSVDHSGYSQTTHEESTSVCLFLSSTFQCLNKPQLEEGEYLVKTIGIMNRMYIESRVASGPYIPAAGTMTKTIMIASNPTCQE